MVTRCRYDLPDDEVIYLTRLQVEILERIVAGDSNLDIARHLCYTKKTIKNYVTDILRELDVRSRTGAAALALTYGVVDLPVIDPAQHPHTIEPGAILLRRRRALARAHARRSARRPPNVTTAGAASH